MVSDAPEHDRNGNSSLDDFEGRLNRARSARPSEPPSKAPPNGMATTLRLAAEMVSALIVENTIGWFLDRWLDTKPWLLLVFLLLGAIASMLNAYRAAMRLSAESESQSPDN